VIGPREGGVSGSETSKKEEKFKWVREREKKEDTCRGETEATVLGKKVESNWVLPSEGFPTVECKKEPRKGSSGIIS